MHQQLFLLVSLIVMLSGDTEAELDDQFGLQCILNTKDRGYLTAEMHSTAVESWFKHPWGTLASSCDSPRFPLTSQSFIKSLQRFHSSEVKGRESQQQSLSAGVLSVSSSSFSRPEWRFWRQKHKRYHRQEVNWSWHSSRLCMSTNTDTYGMYKKRWLQAAEVPSNTKRHLGWEGLVIFDLLWITGLVSINWLSASVKKKNSQELCGWIMSRKQAIVDRLQDWFIQRKLNNESISAH